MGGEQSIPCSELCSKSWDSYANGDYRLQEGWEVTLDDSREVETISTMSSFLATFADIFENLFLGSRDSMSDNVHATLVDVVVKRLQSIIQIDWVNHRKREFCPSPIRFMRMNDDYGKNRKFQGAYYSAERNGTEHLIPQNTYFAEHIEMGPKQLPSLVAII